MTVELPSSMPVGQVEVATPSQGQLRQAVRRAHLLRLAMKGLNATEAAQVVGCAPETARAVYSDVEFRKAVLGGMERVFEGIDSEFVRRKASLHEMLEEQAYSSFTALQELLQEDIHPGLKVKIHQDFMDRCPETQSQRTATLKFDPEQLALAARAAREMDAAIDVKVVSGGA